MRIRTIRQLALACGLVAITQASFGQTFGISLGVREGTSSTTIGAASAATASIEWINAAGIQVQADGLYHTITFNLGTDPTTYFAGNAAGGQTNNVLDGAFVGLEHLRIVNTNGSTMPISIYVDDVITTPNGGSPVTLTDFQSIPTTIANGAANVLFRDPTISGSTTANFARNSVSSAVTNVQPDGTTDTNLQATRLNMRFNTPEVVTGTTGWGRAIASSANPAISANPVIAGVGSTLTMRVAIVINTPQYGYVGFDGVSGNNNWLDNANWGKGTNAATINAPNSTSATALFDEVVPDGNPVTPRTVNLDANVSVQNLQFTTAVPYTIEGTNTLTISRSGDLIVPTINVEAGNQTISAPVVFGSATIAVPTAPTTLTYTPTIWASAGASLTLTQAPTINRYQLTSTGGQVNSLTKRGDGAVSMPDVDVDSMTIVKGSVSLAPTASSTLTTLTLGSTVIPNSGGKISISPAAGATKTITTLSIPASNVATVAGNHTGAGGNVLFTTVNVGANSTLKLDLAGQSSMAVTTFTLNGAAVPTPTVDLGNDGILLDYSAAASADLIRTQVITAFAGGAWTGKGITSSLLPAATNYAIGYYVLPSGALFMGHIAGDATTLGIRYTRKGDHDVDGDVDFDDLLALAQKYDPSYDPNGSSGPRVWGDGDSTYDGIVNFDDLLSLAQNYGAAGLTDTQLTALGGSFAADWTLAMSIVPEPTSLGLIGAATMLVRRRR